MANITHEKLDSKIYGKIKKMILDGELSPGIRIRQNELAARLGVSKTPLLSALRMLETQRLVTSIPRRGYYVSSITMEEMLEIYEIRTVLEGLAARRAAARITEAQKRRLRAFFTGFGTFDDPDQLQRYAVEDRRFHEYVVLLAGAELLDSIVKTFNVMVLSYRTVNRWGQIRGPEETLDEHRTIIEAICAGDPDRAETLMRTHVGRSQARLVEEIAAERA